MPERRNAKACGVRTLSIRFYPEIQLARGAGEALTPADAIHIATEGPIGAAAQRWCVGHGCHVSTTRDRRSREHRGRLDNFCVAAEAASK
jgi:hypothetical protein